MSNVAALARDWLATKAQEQACINSRIAIEEQLAAALGVREEGSETHEVPGYKVTLTQPIYRKVNEEAWKLVAKNCPEDHAPIRHKIEVDVLGVKWLIENKPKIWRKIASAFTTTQGKVGVKVEVL